MAHRADAADARHHGRHFVKRASFAELLKSAYLSHVEVRFFHSAGAVGLQRNLGVTFQSGYRVDQDGS